MGCTCEAWIKGVNYLQNFKWFIRNFYMCINHGIFIGTMFISCSFRARIPCRWYDTLIVCRASIFNMYPVPQTTTRRIYKTNTFSIFIPCIWFKLSHIRYCSITIFNIRYKLVKEVLANICRYLCIKATTCCTSYHSSHPYMSWYTQYL